MLKAVCLLLLGWGLIPVPILGQSNASDAAIDGYVGDVSGGVVTGAQIRIRNLETNVENTTVSNQGGYYRFPLLRLGEYELRASAPGFAEFVQAGIRLSVGQQGRIEITLRVGQSSESITVTEDAAIVAVGEVAQGEVLNERAVRNLPITSRNVYNFHLLGPCVRSSGVAPLRSSNLAPPDVDILPWPLLQVQQIFNGRLT